MWYEVINEEVCKVFGTDPAGTIILNDVMHASDSWAWVKWIWLNGRWRLLCQYIWGHLFALKNVQYTLWRTLKQHIERNLACPRIRNLAKRCDRAAGSIAAQTTALTSNVGIDVDSWLEAVPLARWDMRKMRRRGCTWAMSTWCEYWSHIFDLSSVLSQRLNDSLIQEFTVQTWWVRD